MNTVSVENSNQKIVTALLQEGYEMVEALPTPKDGLTYLLGKEVGDNIHIKVVKKGEVSFKQVWKRGQLISLKLITEAMERQKQSNNK